MKPIEFMDALGDVREEYVRQMLDEEESSAERGKVSGAVLNTELPIAAGADGSRRLSDAGRSFGGKLRYAALLASAAACIAAVVGIMHLRQDSSDNLIAESMLQEMQIETGTTTVSESAAAAVTTSNAEAATETHTTTTKAASTGSTQSVTVTTQTTVTAAGGTASGEEPAKTVNPDTTASAARTTTTAEKTTTSAKTTTTISTTTTLRTTEYTTTTTKPREDDDPDEIEKIMDLPYEQPYLLGDVDADGDVTLIDFFLVWRADTIYSRTGECIIDEAAADRGNIDRILLNNDAMQSMDDSYVRDLALFRAFLGRPDLTAEGMWQLWDEGTFVDDNYISTAYTELMSVYEEIPVDFGLPWYNGWVIVGERVPKPIRDFYNDALGFVTLPGGGETFALDLWTDEEFEQKMDELRTLLAQYKTT